MAISYGTITITDLGSVTKVDVYYYVSTSATKLEGGSWSTDAPVWSDNKYIWSKTVTTWEEGRTTESNPACITGAKGTTGQSGRSVQSIKEQYYLSTSSTSQAGGSWQDAMPTYVNGRYYWTHSIITWKEPNGSTTTETTTAVLANALTSANSTAKSASDTATTANNTAKAANTTAGEAKTIAQEAQSTAGQALTAANNKNKTFYQDSQPTGGSYLDGDSWYDTNDDNKLYIYNGTSKKWVAQQFGNAAIADSSITNAKIANATIQSAKIISLEGAKIVANSITANKLATDAIKSNNYQASPNTSSPYSATGTFLDLSTGNIYTPNFGVDSVNGAAHINGQVIATSGQIGDSSTNYWQIGTYNDYNMNPSAAIIGNGTSYIQSGTWQISNNRINTQTYDGNNQITYIHYGDKYWDYGMKVPELDSTKSTYINGISNNWLYIRRTKTNSIPSLETDWDYLFRVDKDGTIYENGVKLSEKYASIDGVSGAYLPRSGGTITGNLTVNGTLTATASKANALSHTLSINGQSWSGSANLTINTLGVAYGGTGKTTGKDAANYFLNSLDTGSSTPVDGDYYISQYVSGGTTTTTYHRRPMSALWSYVKSKLSNADIYVPKTGGTFTGAVHVEDEFYGDSATLGNLIVNGSGRFNNGIYGDLTGTATRATKVTDSGNNTDVTFAYSKTGMTTTSWLAAWNGYELRAISPANVLTTIGAQPAGNYVSKSGDTMTGDLIFHSDSGNSPAIIFQRGSYTDTLNDWEIRDKGGLLYFGQRGSSSSAFDTSIYLDNSGGIHATTFSGSLSGNATSANKFSSNRTIQLTGDVTGSVSSNGESGWSIATTVGNDSHSHTPETLYIPSDFGKTGTLDLFSGSKIGSYMSNKTFAIPPEAVTIEYSTDNGNTWKDYGAADWHKKGLFSETRSGCNTFLGKADTKEANSINNQLRITISRISLGRYCAVDSFYTWMTTNGNTVYCKLEYSINSNTTVFQTIFDNFQLAGWSGHNIKYFSEKALGGGNNDQVYAYRLTVWQTAINTNYPSANLYDIRFFGRNTYSSSAPYYRLQTNELYTWDNNLNATFPAGITATSFTGNASSASKLNSTRSFTVGKTAKNVDWSGAVSFSQAEISDNASTSAAGWMSKDDKVKLNGIETGAQVNTITGVKGNSETSYRTGNVNITASNIGLGNVTNNKQVKGLSSGTTSGHFVTWGSDGYTVADSGITAGNVVKSVASNSDGKLVLTYADNTTSDPIDVEFVAIETSSVSKAEALNVNGTAVGSATVPVYFDNKGKPQTANTIPKLNNTTTGGTFYAPTGAGTSGQILQSSGGTPSWVNQSKLSVGSATTAGTFTSAASVTLTGDTTGTASSTKGWSITTKTDRLSTVGDNRSVATTPNDYKNKIIFQGLKSNGYIGSPSGGTYSYLVGLRGWSDNSGGNAHELAFNDNGIFRRNGATDTWGSWYKLIDSGNYNSYSPTLTGTGASGTWDIDISGNATTATSATKANITTVANSIAKYSDTSGTFTDSYITIDSSGNLIIGDNDHPVNIKMGAKNDNYGLMPNVNNYGQIGSGSLYWYRGYINNYYGNNSHVNNWDSNKNIGTAATANATSTLGNVNFYNTCAAGGTQTKTNLTADVSTVSNITVTLPSETGKLALTKNYQPYVHYSNTNGNNSGKYYKISINSYIGWMLSFTIRIYHTYRAYDLQISGYNYGSNHWYSPSAIILGSSVTTSIDVLFGYDSDYHLWVAIPADQYTGIDVVNVTNGYYQVDSLEGLFTIEMVDGEPTTVQNTKTAYRPWYRNETVSNATNATNATNAISSTYTTNLLAFAGNEVIIGANSTAKNSSTNNAIYINYRDVSDNSSSNTSTAITDYYFCNRKGGTDGVNIRANTFIGNLTGTATKATQDGDGHTISSSYLKLSGGTMTGAINLSHDKMSINFRPDNTSYYSGLVYGTAGNEALALATRQSITSFMVVHGSDPSTWTNTTWQTASPTIQTKNKSLYINERIDSGVTPTYNFKVNGTSYLGGNVRISDTNADTASCEMQYNRNLQCLEFIFN